MFPDSEMFSKSAQKSEFFRFSSDFEQNHIYLLLNFPKIAKMFKTFFSVKSLQNI